jgi:hypothetical protein
VTPAPSINRKTVRTPFCSKVLFPVSFSSCVIQSEAKNPGSFFVSSLPAAAASEYLARYFTGEEAGRIAAGR